MKSFFQFLASFLRRLFREVVLGCIVGLVLAIVTFLPGYLVGVAVFIFLSKWWHVLATCLGGILAIVLTTMMAWRSLKQYRSISQDDQIRRAHKKSAEGQTWQADSITMTSYITMLSVVTFFVLFTLAPLEENLDLYHGADDPTAASVGVLVLDNICRGLFLDIFEVFELKIGSLKHNSQNVAFCFYLVGFRFVTAALLFGLLYLEFRRALEFHRLDPETLDRELSEDLADLFENIESNKGIGNSSTPE